MDDRLIRWGRAVKSRRGRAPVLWLFTDERRLADPLGAVARLPAGFCGVVSRHDGDPGRMALARAVAALCRRRRIAFSVAGDWRLAVALRAGLHLRGGRRPGVAPRWCRVASSSAHGVAELRRARRAGARLAFLSPVFTTASHPGARPLGPVRWGLMARGVGIAVAALGGVDGAAARRLPRWCAGVGAIGALGRLGG